MARKVTTLQGFLIHDERCKLTNVAAVGAGATDSSYTQATPRPGQSVPDDTCSLIRPQVHAAQSGDLLFGAVRGGNPGYQTCGMVWRKDDGTETASDFRSWNPPNVLEGFQIVSFHSTTARDWDDRAVVTNPADQAVILAAADITGSPQDTSVWLYSAENRSWSARSSVESGWADDTVSLVYHPDLCGFLLLSTPSSENGRAYFSEDGTSWALYATDMLDTAPTTTRRASAVVDRFGHIYLMIVSGGKYETWRSTDLGHTFEQQESVASSWNLGDLTTNDNGDIVVGYTTSSDNLECVILSSSFDTIAAATAITINAATTWEAVAMSRDEDGALYALTRHNTLGLGQLYRSLDNGATWAGLGNPFAPTTTTNVLERLLTCHTGGELMIVANPGNSVSTTYEGTIVALQCGGWDNVEHGETPGNAAQWDNRIGWGLLNTARTWLSQELLANSGWTNFGGGTTALSADGWNYTTTATTEYDQITYTYATVNLATLIELRQVSGGAAATTQIGMSISQQDGSNQTILRLNVTSTGFRIQDGIGGRTTLADISVDMTDFVQILCYWDTLTSVSVWYRNPSSATWSGGSSYTLGTAATGATLCTLQVGCPESGTSETDVMWVAYSEKKTVRHTIAGTTEYDGFTYGKGLDSRPYPLRDEGDGTYRARLSVGGGPARRGDTFSIGARYEHGITNVLPQISPSPKRAWRSTQVATAEDWVFDFGEDTRFAAGNFLALMATGKHCPRTIAVATRADAAGSWTTRGTYDGATGFSSLTYTLSGDILEANGGTEGGRHIYDAEFNGGYAILDTGGTPKVRTILETHGGRWNGSTAEAYFRLDGIDGTESAGATCHIVHPGGVLLIPLTTAAEFRYVRVQVATQDLPDAYYTIGVHCLGGVLVPGHRMSRGWSMRYLPNTTLRQDDYGTTFANKRGPVRREFTWSYQDLSNDLEFLGNSSADHVAAGTGGVELAARHDVFGRLAGMLIQSKGGSLPIVGILDIPDGTSATTITDPQLWIYGLLTGNVVQANHVQGRPGVDTIRRVESLTLREQPWDLD